MVLRLPSKLTFPLLFLTLAAFSACKPDEPAIYNPKLDEMTEFLNSLPVHPTKTELNSASRSLKSRAEIIKKYKSPVSFQEAKEFYLKSLSERDWHFAEDYKPKHKGRNRGERILYFTRDEFVLSVHYAGERNSDLGWDYAVRIAHPPDWREKIS
jgi:hypothetical protein